MTLPIATASPRCELPSVELDGMDVHAITAAQCIRFIIESLHAGRGGWVLTVNLDHLRLCTVDPEFAAICATATLCVADGMPLLWASRLQRTPLPERVAGSDLVAPLAHAAEAHGRSVFLLGGAPGTAVAAAARLRRECPRLRLVGTWCPPSGFEQDGGETGRMLAAVERAQPDLVYVALSKPKQERVTMMLRPRLPYSWVVGVGIGLGFFSGEVRRAPPWMQRTGLEWTHRLAQEPRRLAHRYFIQDLPYAARLFSVALMARRHRGR